MPFTKIKSYVVNTLDIAIIVVIASVVLGGLFNIYNSHIHLLFNRSVPASIFLSIPLSDSLDSGFFNEGEMIYLSENGDEIGKITSVSIIKEKKYTAINNTLVYDFSERSAAVLIEIDSKIKINDKRKYINGSKPISAGSVIEIKTSDINGVSAVIDEIMLK